MEKIVLNKSDTKLGSLENLKHVIKNIAMCHSQEITSEKIKNVVTDRCEFNISEKVKQMLSLQLFTDLDQATVEKEVSTLERSITDILESIILVKDQGIKKLVPLPYEVLNLIFSSTNEKFRQNYFHELIDYYYQELSKNMTNLLSTQVFAKTDFDQQVKVLLPIVKFEVAFQLMNNEDVKSKSLLQEIISNVTLFLKYTRLNQEDIFKVVNNKLNSTNYELLSYELIPTDERNGHLGDYFKLKINVEFEGIEKVFNLFAKFLTPKLEIMKELVRSGPSKKEEFFYLTYLPLLKEHGLQSLLDFTPRCYFSRLDDVLILDDMVALGFTSLTPNIKLDFDSLMFVIKKIAQFHSCSMILEEKLSQKEEKKVTLVDMYEEYLKEVIFVDTNKIMSASFDYTLNVICYLAEKFPEITKNISSDQLKQKITKGWKLLYEQVKRSDKFKNTMCHGDMYVGNMLFNFDTTERCQDAILVDFQLLRYCPPVHDLLFFLHQNSFKDTKDKHYRQLVDIYYEELSQHLTNFNLDIARIYPKEEFEESLIYMKPQAIFQAFVYSPLNMIEPSIREEIFQNAELAQKYFGEDKMALIDLGLETDAYRRFLTGLLQDVVDLCESGSL